MFVRAYASGTNVQRLAKCSKSIDGVIYTSYAELEQTEVGIVKRKFFTTDVTKLVMDVAALDEKVQPSWTKIWKRPMSNQRFITGFFQALVGDLELRPELNLSNMAGETVDVFMVFVSADKNEMRQTAELARKAIPEYEIVVLNGDFTSNRDAEGLAQQMINTAKIAKKRGVIFIANQMGSRSFSVPEIQACVMAFDRGSVDASMQKVSRGLTPTKKDRKLFNGTDKTHGLIIDLSFDPNRSENIERLVIDEAVMIKRSGVVDDFNAAVRYYLTSVDMFRLDEFGYVREISEEEMFGLMGDNEILLRVADVDVNVVEALESGVFDILQNVTAGAKVQPKTKAIVGEDGIDSVVVNGKPINRTPTDKEKKLMEDVINNAVKALNMSATSVFYLADGDGECYRDCINTISESLELTDEFVSFFGVPPSAVSTLLDRGILNEAILDVIVQNSKPKAVDNIFG